MQEAVNDDLNDQRYSDHSDIEVRHLMTDVARNKPFTAQCVEHTDVTHRLVAVHQWVNLLFHCRVAGSVHIDKGCGHMHERGKAAKTLGHLQEPLSAAVVGAQRGLDGVF